MFEFRRLYCAHSKLHAPFPFDGLLLQLSTLMLCQVSHPAGISVIYKFLQFQPSTFHLKFFNCQRFDYYAVVLIRAHNTKLQKYRT